ncbi:MAG: hypothetical protein EHM87_20485 [Burkholderiales bacterium]|nr:MAG: hypothetical protein EHM87_20485 [Burkholderiales bacterium]
MNNDYDKLDAGKNGAPLDANNPLLNEDSADMLVLIKDIYTSRDDEGKHQPRYYVTNDAFIYAMRQVEKKYSLEQLAEFHADCRERDLLGKRKSWHVNAPIEDMDKFFAEKKDKASGEFSKKNAISDDEQSNRYMHLIYAPNKPNVDILKQKPIEKITHLTNCMTAKYGHKAIEVLLDYCVWNRMIPKKGQWTHLTVESDIKTAIKWSVEKPDEYHKAIAKTNIQ